MVSLSNFYFKGTRETGTVYNVSFGRFSVSYSFTLQPSINAHSKRQGDEIPLTISFGSLIFGNPFEHVKYGVGILLIIYNNVARSNLPVATIKKYDYIKQFHNYRDINWQSLIKTCNMKMKK